MNIFVFTSSNKDAQQHLRDTVEKSVDENVLREFLSVLDFEILKNASRNSQYYCWGSTPGQNNERNWNLINEGDFIMNYANKKYHHYSKIIFKLRNKSLAEKLWGSDNDGNTWEYMYFFEKPIAVLPPVDAEKLSEYLPASFQGFSKIKEDRVASILNNFKSIENFFDSFFNIFHKNFKDITHFNSINNMQILTAIKTKPFILLAGISGTGKSRLVRTLAYKTCNKEALRIDLKKPGNFELIPVRPNWHDSSELMGYVSRINGEKYIVTSFLKFIAKAWENADVPFFLCLDEMNLAPVEQYFAEFLSIIETRQVINDEIVTDFLISKSNFENPDLYKRLLTDLGLNEITFSEGIGIPENLIVIGTVNMDETTHSFSRKVLDRAMTFEMNDVDLSAGLDLTMNDWNYPETFIHKDEVIGKYTSGAEVYAQAFEKKDEVISFLRKINNELEGTPFKIAYRVRDEFLMYCYYVSLNKIDNWLIDALDEMTVMKILSRIEGDEAKTGDVIEKLQRILTSEYKKSNAKLRAMEKRLQSNGYTSFWE